MDDVRLVRLFACLQAYLPVNYFRFQGVHLWPIVRVQLIYMLHRELEALERNPGYAPLAQAVDRLFDRTVADGLVRPAADRPEASFAPCPPVADEAARPNVLCFVRPEEYSREDNDEYVSRLLDPWLQRMEKRCNIIQIECAVAESVEKQPRRRPVLLLPPFSHSIAQNHLSEFNKFDTRDVAIFCTMVAEFCQREFGLNLENFFQTVISALFNIHYQKKVFDGYIQAYRPRAAFLFCYYHTIAQALLWSCHEHGVRTVEFQHGLNGYYHFGYTHWTSVPPDGYATLPDVFLTWGESSANNIRRWLPGNGPSCPAVVVGGRLDFLPPSGPASGALGDALSAARANHDKIILVTLSQGLDIVYGLAPVLVEMMLKAPRSWFWLIRAHPRSINEDKGSKDKERYRMFVPWGVDEHLRGQGLSNFETALASAAPLLPLLSQIDHHVTGVSSCYLEAAAMNVPTSFFHVLARDVWKGELEAGLAHYADTADGLIATIERGWQGLRQAGHAAITNNDALAESTIRYLLAPPTATGQTPQAWIPGASRLA